MGQEYFINSQNLENAVRQLLPSQGGAGAGVDLSASTQIVPVVNLTETAEGSVLREDLQRSFSLDTITSFDVENTTTSIITTTGYFRVFGTYVGRTATADNSRFILTDGIVSKILLQFTELGLAGENNFLQMYDFMVKIEAGHSLQAVTTTSNHILQGATRQIADLSGNLTNP